ncbi:MAG: PilX N-terminal domain-containing pilus assembly protein [Thiotrichales bacterium]
MQTPLNAVRELQGAGRQQGFTLIVALIVLMVITLTAMSAVRSVTLEERMIANDRDRGLAFQAAEAAVRDGIAWLEAQGGPIVASGDGDLGVWTLGSVALDELYTPAFWVDTENLHDYPLSPALNVVAGVAEQPRFLVEELAFAPDDNDPATIAARRGFFFYRITARGLGGTETARSLVQAFHRIRYF